MAHFRYFFCFLPALAVLLPSFAQVVNTEKKLMAIAIESPIKVDGILDEGVWENAEIAGDFIDYEPFNGRRSPYRTEVRVLYDAAAVYIGARMLDQVSSDIMKELGKRDEALDINADAFCVEFCPFNDALNGFGFGISASGVLIDMKITGTDRDEKWDAVWSAAVSSDVSGWYCEFRIPYSSLRFPNAEEQVWGLNFWRQVRKTREWSTWSFVDKSNDAFLHQAGLLYGIRGIKPPIRLSLNPYASSYLLNNGKEWQKRINGGMDLKYGLNQSYTLDLTLIPDFGQVESDEVVLNLSPFEIQYGEKRHFFMEGNELFSRAGIFYTRRIGDRPKFNPLGSKGSAAGNVELPSETQLLNAFKLTGRDRQGMAIGILNALTRPVHAEWMPDSETRIDTLVQPVCNYTVLVLDKSLKNNSYFSMINTSLVRFGDDYASNVTAVDFDVNTPKLNYGLKGLFSFSDMPVAYFDTNGSPAVISGRNGIRYNLAFSKRTGRFLFTLSQYAVSKGYNHNDLGYIDRSNIRTSDLVLSYRQYQPKGYILRMNSTLTSEYQALFEGNKYSAALITWSNNLTLRNQLTTGLYLETAPFDRNDYYEPRVPGRLFETPSYYACNGYISTDYSKPVALDMSATLANSYDGSFHSFAFSVSPRFRAGNRLLIVPSVRVSPQYGDRGYVNHAVDSAGVLQINMGERDVKTVITQLSSSYRFSANSSVSLRYRHYWSSAAYKRFFRLNMDGSLSPSNELIDADVNFNAYTLDFGFNWDFAPGSQLSFVLKQSSNDFQSMVISNYLDNLKESLQAEMLSSLSIKVIYYIDYATVKARLKSG